jgi:hypothetical protein
MWLIGLSFQLLLRLETVLLGEQFDSIRLKMLDWWCLGCACSFVCMTSSPKLFSASDHFQWDLLVSPPASAPAFCRCGEMALTLQD